MKMIDYLNEAKNNVGNDIVAIRFYYGGDGGDTDGYESDNFEITDTHLIFEDIMFDLNTTGEYVDGIFWFVDGNGDAVGIETWF